MATTDTLPIKHVSPTLLPRSYVKLVRVFVYGTLKRGYGNWHRLLNGQASFIGEGVTKPEYTMLDMGYFPAVIPGGKTSIHGEIFDVSPDVLNNLDRLEGHPDWYQRTPITLLNGDAVEMYVISAIHTPKVTRAIKSGMWKGER